jgi:uncharacterized membrane protein
VPPHPVDICTHWKEKRITMNLSFPRTLIVALAIGLTTVIGASPALAATATGSQNPDLTVTLSVTPDTVTTGQSITAEYAVTNETALVQTVSVTQTLMIPGQSSPIVQTNTLRLRPGQTKTDKQTVKIDASYPRGQYGLTVSAADSTSAPSSATVSYTIV